MQYDDRNTFILFREQDKKTEKSPDYTGKFTDENEKEWRIAAWERTSKNGKVFLSGKVSEFQEQTGLSGYEKAKAVAENLRHKDVAPVDITDEVDLSEIPFN